MPDCAYSKSWAAVHCDSCVPRRSSRLPGTVGVVARLSRAGRRSHPLKDFGTESAVTCIGGIAWQKGQNVADALIDEVQRLRARVNELERQVELLAEAEEQIQGVRAQAQALLDNIPHMAWMKDHQGRFLAVNEAFANACARSKEEILGKTDREVWPLEHAERYMADDRRVVETGEKYFTEEPIAENGETKWFETLKTPIRDSRGLVIGTVGLARDITQRKQAEEQRQLLERRVSESQRLESLGGLAGGIAHDFNNLLVGVLSNAELGRIAAQRCGATRDVLERLSDITDTARHAAELTNQLLAYSGRGHFDLRPISLSDVVHEMAHLLGVSVSKRVHLEYDLMESLPAVQADSSQMRQVIMNLVINASDALLERGGTVLVRTGTQHITERLTDVCTPAPLSPGSYVFLEVSDNGCGMDGETRRRLFDPFFTTKFTGRGLGLSAVHGIVRGHHGGIVVRTAAGEGTSMKVLFPQCAQPPTPMKYPDCTPLPWTAEGLVLLVDDDARVRSVTTLLLADMGFDVLSAKTGRDAIEQFDRHSEAVRVVVLDVTMPDLSGDQVVRALRERRSDVPILLCSGYSPEEMRHRFTPKDMETFLQKPYSLQVLRSRLRALVERAPRSAS